VGIADSSDGGIDNDGDTGSTGDADRNAALEALAHWVRARILLHSTGEPANAWPGAALIAETGPAYPTGTILFLPDQLIRRVFYAEGADAWIDGVEHWAHPDRSGVDGDVFTAAAMLYRILCGTLPYPNRDLNVVRQDLREGIFVPPGLAAPGLNDEPAALITKALTPSSPSKGKQPPRLEDFENLLAVSGRDRPASTEKFFHPVSGTERAKLDAEREQFIKSTKRAVGTKRFVRRNITILGGALAALVVIALVAASFVRGNANRPTTKGMEPVQVVETYYGAFNTLDHTLMEACVINKAGKGDISMVTNLFVMGRIRQAYESIPGVISPEEWLEYGGGPSERTVFGVTDLKITGQGWNDSSNSSSADLIRPDTGPEYASCRVSYLLWTPFTEDAADSTAEQTPEPELTGPAAILPTSTAITDEVRLERDKKGLWHIAEIVRTGR
jgi:hypothetical protein